VSSIKLLLISLRPKQWSKNLLVFAGYLFTIEQGHQPAVFARAVAAFAVFCAISGAGYIFNDVFDVVQDRKHPRKQKRPIASGDLKPGTALIFAIILTALSIVASFYLSFFFGLLTTAYFLLTLTYSGFLKHVVIVDLLVIAAGFVIRAAAGAVVIDVTISPWLLVCTTLLALFLGLAKRRSEMVNLENGGVECRKILNDYTEPMVDQMLNIAASASLMAYFLYTFTPTSATGNAHPYMMITVPFVIYGLFRYLFLVHSKNAGDSPEQLLIEDKPLLINIVLYVIAVIFALKV
jgi:4-hydroxybenzoate polyprenyltransferase